MVLKAEVLQVRKQSNFEEHNLPTGPSHACQGERSECWRELSKILLDPCKMKLGISNISIESSRTLVNAENSRRVRLLNSFAENP